MRKVGAHFFFFYSVNLIPYWNTSSAKLTESCISNILLKLVFQDPWLQISKEPLELPLATKKYLDVKGNAERIRHI